MKSRFKNEVDFVPISVVATTTIFMPSQVPAIQMASRSSKYGLFLTLFPMQMRTYGQLYDLRYYSPACIASEVHSLTNLSGIISAAVINSSGM